MNVGIDAAVLAGGLSTRFGSDKADALFAGQSLLDTAVDNLRHIPQIGRIFVSSNIPREPHIIIPDNFTHCGPLGGIEAVLQASEASAVLFVTCDMPLVDIRLLQPLVDRWMQTRNTTAYIDGQPVPLPCIINVEAHTQVCDLLKSGRRSLRALFDSGSPDYIPLLEYLRPLLVNVNTQQALNQITNNQHLCYA